MKKNIYITQKIPAIAENLLRAAGLTVTVNQSGDRLSQEALANALRDADGAICLLSDRIDADIINNLHKCKVLANYAVGFNNIDIEAAKTKGIQVTNTPDVLTDATADLTLALILAAARHIVQGDAFMRHEKFTGWGPFLYLGTQLSSATVGIIGAGRIGSAVARRLKAFGCKILYSANSRKLPFEKKYKAEFTALDDLLSVSDIITIHTPLNNSTKCLLNKKRLRLLKKNSILVNTARGEIVDEPFLIELLKKRKIQCAAFDVYDKEPVVNKELFTLDNVILAPHIGSATYTARNKMAEIAANNIIRVLEGKKPITPVY